TIRSKWPASTGTSWISSGSFCFRPFICCDTYEPHLSKYFPPSAAAVGPDRRRGVCRSGSISAGPRMEPGQRAEHRDPQGLVDRPLFHARSLRNATRLGDRTCGIPMAGNFDFADDERLSHTKSSAGHESQGRAALSEPSRALNSNKTGDAKDVTIRNV